MRINIDTTFTFEQLEEMVLREPPRHWFVRPNASDGFSGFKSKFSYQNEFGTRLGSQTTEFTAGVVRAIYSVKATGSFPYSPLSEKVLFHIWMRQQGDAKRQFSFRTAGKTISKSKVEKKFTVRLVNDNYDELNIANFEEWEVLVAHYIIGRDKGAFAEFIVAIEQHIKTDKNATRFIAQLYQKLRGLKYSGSSWPEFILQLQRAVPGNAGGEIISIFFDAKKMNRFDLRSPEIENLIDIVLMDSSLAPENQRKWRSEVNWSLVDYKLDKKKQVEVTKKFLRNERHLPDKFVYIVLRYVWPRVLSYDLEGISKATKARIEKDFLQNSALSEFEVTSDKVLRNLVELTAADAALFSDLVVYLVKYEKWRELDFLYHRYPSEFISVVLENIEVSNEERALRRYIGKTLQLIQNSKVFSELVNHVSSRRQLYVVLETVEFNVEYGYSKPAVEWARTLEHILETKLSRSKWLRVQSFLLVMALRSSKPGCELIYEECFLDVYNAWANRRLSPESKSMLRKALGPRRAWTWDWCYELFKAVADVYDCNDNCADWLENVRKNYSDKFVGSDDGKNLLKFWKEPSDPFSGEDWEQLTESEQADVRSATKDDVRAALESLIANQNLDDLKGFIDVPVLGAFADFEYFYLKVGFSWRSKNTDATVRSKIDIPGGFVTDFASIPRMFWSFIPKDGMHVAPAILHDWLYWAQFEDIPRDTADEVFYEAMVDTDVEKRYRIVIYNAVRAFGASVWKANADAKANGESRLLEKLPNEKMMTWERWKANRLNYKKR